MKRYPGGKNASGTHQWIIGRQPTHAYYAEPFVGSGAITRRKVPALETVVCDRDPRVVNYWARLRSPGVTAIRTCGIAWLRDNAARLTPDWLVYLDPPYLPSTRVKLRMYRFEMTPEQHAELLDVVVTLNCRVMLSGYPSPVYDRRLRGWAKARHTRRVMTRGRTWRTEVLWCNFRDGADDDRACPTPGRDYRDRERIKKRVRRWRAKFTAMPDHERTALLSELIRVERQAAARAAS